MAKKICSDCGKKKKLSKFSAHKLAKDGKSTVCRKCMRIRARNHAKTKEGVITLIYGNQRGNSRKRGHRLPEYDRQALSDWLYSQKLFHELYDEWVQSGYDRNLKPSVDRKDDSIHYCFSNIQLMTFGENNAKDKLLMRRGVEQYSLDGEFIAEFNSATEASKELGINRNHIGSVCNGNRESCGGFLWKHATEQQNKKEIK